MKYMILTPDVEAPTFCDSVAKVNDELRFIVDGGMCETDDISVYEAVKDRFIKRDLILTLAPKEKK